MPLRVVNVIPQTSSAETNFDSEPSIAVNPSNTQQLVVTAFTPDTPAPMKTITTAPYYFSSDGGTTWAKNTVIPGGTALLGTKDISVRFAGSGVLYAGVLRADSGGPGGTLNILRKQNYTNTVAPTVLLSRAADDQPWVEAVTEAGTDRVYVASNDVSQRTTTGHTASVDLSLDAAGAGTFTTARLEVRATAALVPPTAGNQDGPSVRVAIHPSGVIYGAFFGWRTFATAGNTTDIVVVRDDGWASGATPFQALRDPAAPAGDGLAGRRVATGVTIASLGTTLGTQRIGSNLSLAVDPRDSQRVYVAWCDGLATTASPYTLRVRRSDDGGRTWTGNLYTRANATNPGLAVNARGTVALLHQELVTVAGVARWRTHLVESIDGFQTVLTDTTLADTLDSSTGATITVIIGDYDNLLAIGKDFYGVFCAQNLPDAANFPAGVTYQRNADFAAKTLRAVDNLTPVSTSVDPYFFHESPLEPASGTSRVGLAPLSDARLELWTADGAGGLLTTWKWSADPNAEWTPWSDFLGEVGAIASGAREVAVAPLSDARLELWVSDGAGGLWSTWKTTTDPNADWTPWADFLAEVGALPGGARQVAVAPLSDGRLELWVSTGTGGQFTTWKTTTDPNANWTGWSDFLAEVGALPNGARDVAVAPLPDGRLELWTSDGAGGLWTTWKTTTDPNADWTPWSDFLAEVGALPSGARDVTVAPLSDGRLELWTSDGAGGLWTTWKTTTDPNADWTPWSDFLAEVGALPGGARDIAVAPLPDGRLEFWATTGTGGLFTTWKTTTDPNADWTPWSDFLAEV